MKADEVDALRAQTLREGRRDAARRRRRAARAPRRRRHAARARQRRLGDRRDGRRRRLPRAARGRGWPARRALDLTEDPAIITALANDIGTDAIFSRQVIAYGGPGDALIALSTSGNSGSVIAALIEARRRGLATIALRRLRRRAGGRRRARRPRDRHALGAHPAHPGGAGERVPRARGSWSRPREAGPGAGRGDGPGRGLPARSCTASPRSSTSRATCSTTSAACCSRSRAASPRSTASCAGWRRRRRRWRRSRRCARRTSRPRASAASASSRARAAASRPRSSRPTPRPARTASRELFDPSDRRYRYPFVNCTNCGPRFTIVRGVPYDRPLTTMAGFELCPRCAAEYEDPADRRFHAQPNACPECGPTLRLLPGDDYGDEALRGAVAALREGRIVAVKGIGGYHLACLAANETAVAALRARKHREDKPFAVMVRDVAARARARRADGRGGGAAGRPRPPDRARAAARRTRAVAPSVAPRSADLGVLLPYSPLHHLLLADVGEPLVMTSGNVSDEPIAHEDADALERLAGIADLVLFHDRPIHTRTDDSVLRAVPGRRPLLMRRSRGFVPDSLALPVRRGAATCSRAAPSSRARSASPRASGRGSATTSATSRRTRCCRPSRRGSSTSSGCSRSCPRWSPTTSTPTTSRPATRWPARASRSSRSSTTTPTSPRASPSTARPARRSARSTTAPATGSDGTVWGGELLVGDLRDFERAGHLWPVRLPGGDRAVRQPWRMAMRVAARGGLGRAAARGRTRSAPSRSPSSCAPGSPRR